MVWWCAEKESDSAKDAADDHKPIENPEKLLATYLAANVGHLNEWDWNIFAFEKDVRRCSVCGVCDVM
jgi:hypothetical protein